MVFFGSQQDVLFTLAQRGSKASGTARQLNQDIFNFWQKLLTEERGSFKRWRVGGLVFVLNVCVRDFFWARMKDDVFLRNDACSKEYLKEKLCVVDRAKEVLPECETQCPERYLNWFIEKSTAAYEIKSGFCYYKDLEGLPLWHKRISVTFVLA